MAISSCTLTARCLAETGTEAVMSAEEQLCTLYTPFSLCHGVGYTRGTPTWLSSTWTDRCSAAHTRQLFRGGPWTSRIPCHFRASVRLRIFTPYEVMPAVEPARTTLNLGGSLRASLINFWVPFRGMYDYYGTLLCAFLALAFLGRDWDGNWVQYVATRGS